MGFNKKYSERGWKMNQEYIFAFLIGFFIAVLSELVFPWIHPKEKEAGK